MRQQMIVATALAALGACAKKDEAATPPPPPPVAIDAALAIDAAPVAIDAGDPEAARRQGKRTGLGAPDELPEVVVEALIAAIAEGKVPATRFIDPAEGYLEHTTPRVTGSSPSSLRLAPGAPRRRGRITITRSEH
jgi:hypothetical protein